MAKTDGFVPLTSLTRPERPAPEIIAEIRRLYFGTTAGTIEQDFAHAIALLQSLPEEHDRDKAAVYMEGLTEMRTEWARPAKAPGPRTRSPKKSASKPAKPRR